MLGWTLGLGLSLGTACSGKGGPQDSGDGGVAGALLESVEVELSASMPTVALVTVRTAEPAAVQARFGLAGSDLELRSAVSSDATEHRLTLVGIPEGEAAEVRIEAWTAEASETSALFDYEAGTLAAELPRPTLTSGSAADLGSGFFLAPMAGIMKRFVTITDMQGRLVWGFGGSELETQRARFTKDGQGLIVMDREKDQSNMELVRVDWEGNELWRLPVPEGHHDFDLIDDETFVSLAYDPQLWVEGSEKIPFVADKLLELTTAGEVREIWKLYDYVQAENGDAVRSQKGGGVHWSHSNYVHYLPDTDRIQVTSRRINLGWSIARADGAVDWILGEVRGDFENLSETPLLAQPHSIWAVDGGVMVFNQGLAGSDECSSASVLALDTAAMTAQLTWSYVPDPCLRIDYLGNAQPMSDGRVLVSFGKAGVLDVAAEDDGRLLGRFGLEAGEEFLYIEHTDTIGQPRD